MQKTRKLKMPDGGSFDLAVPGEFGSPILAMNDSSPITPKTWLVVGVIAGLLSLGAFLKWHLSQKA